MEAEGVSITQAKSLVNLQIIAEQSTNAIGDFARSQESFANQSRIAKAATEDLKSEIGQALLPIATNAVSIFGDLAGKLADYVAERNKLVAAEKAMEAGNATIEDRILLEESELENLNATLINQVNSLKAADDLNGAYGVRTDLIEDNIKQTQDQIQLAAETLRNLEKQKYWTDQNTKAEEEKAAAEKTSKEIEEEQSAAALENTAKLAGEIRNDLIGQALVPMTEAEKEMWQAFGEGAVEAGKATKALKEDIEAAAEATIDWESIQNSAITSVLSGS